MATPIPMNRATFALAELATMTGGTFAEPVVEPATVTGVTTDSRAVGAGALFVGLRGERFDGATFARKAVAQGAAAVLVARTSAAEVAGIGVPALLVEDPTAALGDIAHAHRVRWGGTVVAITGSVGKTTTKELMATALEASLGRPVARTAGNLNNEVGLPATLLCLDDSSRVAVVELGTSGPGEIARLGAIAAPDVAVVTRAAVAHTEGLGTLEAVADEKTSLFESLEATGTAVACRDDEAVWARVGRGPARRRYGFGRTRGADVCVMSRGVDADLGSRIVFDVAGHHLPVRLQLLGEGAAMNAAAALAVAHALGVDLGVAAAALAGVAPVPGRLELRSRPGGTVLDDSYNASPRSMELALETAAELVEVTGGRVVAVLGDMKELGAESGRAHLAVARDASRLGVAVLVGVGDEMRAAIDAAEGLDAVWADDAETAWPLVAERLQPGDLVLVKGSRSMRMERLVDHLVDGDAGAARKETRP